LDDEKCGDPHRGTPAGDIKLALSALPVGGRKDGKLKGRKGAKSSPNSKSRRQKDGIR